MSASGNTERLHIVERQHGQVLRLLASANSAMTIAVDILGFLEAELEAEIENAGWKSGYRLKASDLMSVRLEGLYIELMTDGSEVMVRRVAGSADEFEDLCDLIASEFRGE
jgi:hypothetical protein